MSKITFALRVSSLLLTMFLCANLSAQHLMKEISLEKQVSNSNVIIEGEVISKEPFWDKDHKHIYTVNTVKVHKIFKGDVADEIQIITPGGTIGLKAEVVSPSLDVYKNDRGIFMLNKKDISLESNKVNANVYEAYSSAQGFYRYNEYSNIAVNPFKKRSNIVGGFYKEITDLTSNEYKKLSDFDIQDEINKTRNSSSTLEITSISPTTASAGTKEILTITGTGFTNSQWRVGFPFTDNGGSTYVNAYEGQIISWSNTEIRVEIPSFAGTGPVRVTTTTGTQFFSDELTITYAHINLDDGTNTEDATREDISQLIDDDGNGGYNWLYNTEFNNNTAAKEAFRRAFDAWVCQTGVNWTIGGVNGTDVADDDGVNIVRFDNGEELPASTLGRTTTYFNGCQQGDDIRWFSIEVDMVFDDGRNWQYGPAGPSGGQIDFETVAVHELGHAALLGHIIDQGAIMHYAIGANTFNRELEPNDIVGAEAMMNRSVNDPVCGQPAASVSSCSLSVNDLLTDVISIYPNPAESVINITCPSDFVIDRAILYDIRGREVISRSLNLNDRTATLDLNVINAGIYFVKIESNRGSLTKKIIIK